MVDSLNINVNGYGDPNPVAGVTYHFTIGLSNPVPRGYFYVEPAATFMATFNPPSFNWSEGEYAMMNGSFTISPLESHQSEQSIDWGNTVAGPSVNYYQDAQTGFNLDGQKEITIDTDYIVDMYAGGEWYSWYFLLGVEEQPEPFYDETTYQLVLTPHCDTIPDLVFTTENDDSTMEFVSTDGDQEHWLYIQVPFTASPGLHNITLVQSGNFAGGFRIVPTSIIQINVIPTTRVEFDSFPAMIVNGAAYMNLHAWTTRPPNRQIACRVNILDAPYTIYNENVPADDYWGSDMIIFDDGVTDVWFNFSLREEAATVEGFIGPQKGDHHRRSSLSSSSRRRRGASSSSLIYPMYDQSGVDGSLSGLVGIFDTFLDCQQDDGSEGYLYSGGGFNVTVYDRTQVYWNELPIEFYSGQTLNFSLAISRAPILPWQSYNLYLDLYYRPSSAINKEDGNNIHYLASATLGGNTDGWKKLAYLESSPFTIWPDSASYSFTHDGPLEWNFSLTADTDDSDGLDDRDWWLRVVYEYQGEEDEWGNPSIFAPEWDLADLDYYDQEPQIWIYPRTYWIWEGYTQGVELLPQGFDATMTFTVQLNITNDGVPEGDEITLTLVSDYMTFTSAVYTSEQSWGWFQGNQHQHTLRNITFPSDTHSNNRHDHFLSPRCGNELRW